MKQLQVRYVDSPLENAHQLAFVLIASQKEESPFKFKVLTKGGLVELLHLVLYPSETETHFLPDECVLDEKYRGIAELLFSTGIRIFRTNTQVSICKEPYIEGEQLALPGIKAIQGDSRVEFLEFLKRKWKALPEPLKSLRLSHDVRWSVLLGFDPMLTIHGSEFIHEGEKLPEDVQHWLEHIAFEVNASVGVDLLKAIGVSFGGADIIRIRKYLVEVDDDYPSLNYNLPSRLLLNTFELLENRNVRFQLTQKRTELLKDLYARCAGEVHDTIPLPIIDSAAPNSVTVRKVLEAKLLSVEMQEALVAKGVALASLPGLLGKEVILEQLMKSVENIRSAFDRLSLEFDKLDTDRVLVESTLWSAAFYTEWQSASGIEIRTFPGEMPRLLMMGERVIHHYNEGQIGKVDKVVVVNRELDDKKILSLLRENRYLSTAEIDDLETRHEEYQQMMHDYMSKINSQPALREAWQELEKQLKQEEKKKQLSDGFAGSKKYSYRWFMSLLELMVLAGDGKDSSATEGEIVFGKLEIDPMDLRVITLADPSKSISPSIEMFTDFRATFVFRDNVGRQKRKEIRIKGLSKKGQRLYALPANQQELQNIQETTIQCVELKFTRVLDLINRLMFAFRSLGLADEVNLKSELTDNINFIFGPPGTGKTTHIAKLVIDKIINKISKRILILTPTNKAADVLVKRILKLADEKNDAYPDGWLARFGTSTDTDILDRAIVYDSNTLELHLYNQCALVTTIHRFPYEQIRTAKDGVKSSLADVDWDTIIFDESSMIMLPAIVYPLFKRKFRTASDVKTEFIVGGDPLQIPPVFDLPDEDLPENQRDVKEENIYSMVGLKSFRREDQISIPVFGKRILNLETQYRSIEIIGKLFSKFQYHNRLLHGRSRNEGGPPNPRVLPECFKNLGFKPITVIRYPVNTLDSIYRPEKLNKSPFQLYSAFLVNELVKRFGIEVNSDEWNIGVICPYRSQASLLNKMIESQSQRSNITVISDTVHGFQGDECDLVFAVFNPSSSRSQFSQFLQKEYIINVAISRARDYIILLIPDADTEGLNSLKLIHEAYEGSLLRILTDLPHESVAILDAKDIEKKLMGIADYFAANSFTNVHQTVNVYGEPEMDYMVRLSGNAIDIHWKNHS